MDCQCDDRGGAERGLALVTDDSPRMGKWTRQTAEANGHGAYRPGAGAPVRVQPACPGPVGHTCKVIEAMSPAAVRVPVEREQDAMGLADRNPCEDGARCSPSGATGSCRAGGAGCGWPPTGLPAAS